ncbi:MULTISPECIES: cyclic peptide export ABC transporter [unclassified Janthinobacterium]|uniref:cyclic peptide export ABC transporter n=1 Tax=unclassified Janthinobacterium TaxID=2610881 RepID=UPI00034CAB96|nr:MULTISPECIES: cyclic peptide export ABC transporter [unclassified Janthinobacterium]MEC5160910.1 putative ATP-binding cassette transporter [Janthinobacterium sp. CG_S6]
MKMINYLFRQSWKLLLFSTVCAIISGISGAGLAAVIGSEINGNVPGATLAWLFVALGLISLLTRTCSAFSLMHLVQTAILRLRINISGRLLQTSFKKLQELGKPALLAILTNDISTLINAFHLLPITFGNAILIVICLGYLAWVSLPVFSVIAVILVTGIFLYHWLERKPLQSMAELREHMDILYRNFRSLIDGSRELQLNAQRGTLFVDKVIAPAALDNKRLFIAAMKGYIFADNIGTLMFYCGFGALLFVVPFWIAPDTDTLTKFTIVLLFLIGPISQLMGALPVLRNAEISLKKIQQLEGSLAAENMRKLLRDPFAHGLPLHLELRGVCHHYSLAGESNRFMLGPLDLSIRQGETLFVVGGNGSGKTTLAMLLLGFYQAEQGNILLNGKAVNAENLGNYREYFSAIFSDFHLFEQLLLADQDELSERAAHYVREFGLAHKVNVVNGKFTTIDLSTGQRKRLAMVSSYLEDRPVYLFDEWAADQDPVFKRVFYTELLPELKARGKTIIVITHDDTYFSYADRVIKIEHGQIQSIDNGMAIHAMSGS